MYKCVLNDRVWSKYMSRYDGCGSNFTLATRAAEPEPGALEPAIFGGAGAVFKIWLEPEPELVVNLAAPAPDPF